jgi:pyruvate,water dikinase
MEHVEGFIAWFDELRIEDVPKVGGKNAALGEMFSNLTPLGVNVPPGFAITADAYRFFMQKAGLVEGIKKTLDGLDTHNIKDLQRRGKTVRDLILRAKLPDELNEAVTKAYAELGKRYGKDPDVAVRSSATAEDLPGASFAGQQETYLNVRGIADVLLSTKKCIASLFTDRAISYRVDKGFSHFDAALSVGVQKMVRSDLAVSGVMFTLDTETGFEDAIIINASYGLGEMIVQGKVTPDEFIVFKPALKAGFRSIIARNLGEKKRKIIYAGHGIKEVEVPPKEQVQYCLTDDEILKLATWGAKIEDYFSEKHGHHQPMDIEWAKDGAANELFIVQARPETVYSSSDKNIYREYVLGGTAEVLVKGTAVGSKIGTGKVKIIHDAKRISDFVKGEVLVTEITDPDWEPIMKIASAIVTDKGGRTSHAAIVSRELGIPCIVGSSVATKKLTNGTPVTVDCSSGKDGLVYKGELPFEVKEHHLDQMPETRTKIMVNIGSPDEAFKNHFLPVKGVGLAREEFIIASHIKIHPNALIEYEKLKTDPRPAAKAAVAAINAAAPGYADKTQYYVDELTEGIALIGAAFHPHEVIVRFSDFKTNEYRKLVGGELYEPEEENPMIGWRGASRYYHPDFATAFGLEVKAMKRVREELGLKNVVPMIPFCRTPEEGRKVLETMERHGLKRGEQDLKVYVMCEIPSNIMRAEEFLDVFDGMSIGSNDLTQLTVGVDRDSNIVNGITNENDAAVKKLIEQVIKICREKGKYIGICGQAPSDYPEFAAFLVERGIVSMSLNPDTIVKALSQIAEVEKKFPDQH